MPQKSPPEHKKSNNYVDDDIIVAESALVLLLRLSRYAGVAPLRASRARAGWRFHASPRAAALHAVTMALLNVIMLAAIILDFCQTGSYRIRLGDTALQAFVWLSDVVLVMAIANIAVFRGPALMESLKLVLDDLQQVKIDLKISAKPPKIEKMKYFSMVIYLLWTSAIMITDFVLHCKRVRSEEAKVGMIMMLYGLYYVVDLQGVLAVLRWASAASEVHEGSAALNQHLHRLLYDSVYLTHPSLAVTLIRRLALSHERISDVMRHMNDTNGLILMLILMSKFLRLVITPYYAIMQLNTSKHVVLDATLSINWSLVHMSVMLLVIEPCHWTHTQREHTRVLLSHLIVHLAPKSERLFKEVDQFSKQIMLSSANFMTLGVYTLDRPLMATILGGVTTYLVIIIQFQTISDQL